MAVSFLWRNNFYQIVWDCWNMHCESGKELWLQGEAASQKQSCRDAEPQLVIQPKKKENHEMPPMQLRPGIHICLTSTDPFLPIIAWTCNDDNCSWSSQLVPSIPPGQSFLFICLFLAVWLCLKKCSENRVLVLVQKISQCPEQFKLWLSKPFIKSHVHPPCPCPFAVWVNHPKLN